MKLQLALLAILIAAQFIQKSSATTINCTYHMDYWTNVPLDYQCTVANIKIFKGIRLTIAAANGVHLPLKSDNDVRYLHISDAPNLNFFPRNLSAIFRRLSLIRVSNSRLAQIERSDLAPFAPHLRFVNLDGNTLKVIRDDTFEDNRELEVVELLNNQIVHVGQTAFSGLRNLRALSLYGNAGCHSISKTDTYEAVMALVRGIESGRCSNVNYETAEDARELRRELHEVVAKLATESARVEKARREINTKIEALSANFDNFSRTVMSMLNADARIAAKMERLREISAKVDAKNQEPMDMNGAG